MSALPGLEMLPLCAGGCGTHRAHSDPRDPDCLLRRVLREAGSRLEWPRIGLVPLDSEPVFGQPAQVPQGEENWDRCLERAPRVPSVQAAWRIARAMLTMLPAPPEPIVEEEATQAPSGRLCVVCGAPVEVRHLGPPARCCGAACRKRASRARQTA